MALTPEERNLIRSLFERVRAQSNGPRDADAETLITMEMRNNPAAAYVMVQTIMMQEQAMQMNAERISQLEAELEQARRMPGAQPVPQSGGFLSGFGGGARPSGPWGNAAPQQPGYPQAPQQAAPWGGQPMAPQQPAQSGGFMRSALATAAGVAGGAMLFNGISNMFGGGNRHAEGGMGAMSNPDATSGASPSDLTNNFGHAAPQSNDGFQQSAAYDDGEDDGFDSGDSGGDWA